MTASRLQKFVQPAKIVIALSLLGILLYYARQSYRDLEDQPKNWSLLILALLCSVASHCLTFIRWYLLVRALGLKFSLHDAFRLGCVGVAMNFVSPGSVGGDLFKA